MEKNQLIIVPKTKLSQLLETYPQLEDVLIKYAPAFKKLKNPVLRKTIAKVVTVQQAASVGNVKVEELINVLRKEVGQDTIQTAVDSGYSTNKPDWFDLKKVANSLDVREMLNAGEHPVNQVISDLNQLKDGELYELIVPFIPAPLIDKATSINMIHWIEEKGPELYHVYFKRK